MSHFNQSFSFHAPAIAAPAQPTLWRRITAWLQGCCESECHRADRPDRIVPYY